MEIFINAHLLISMKNIENHTLQLNDNPFYCIKNKTKTIEMRLFDEKRQKIKVGDTITFLNCNNHTQQVFTKVKALYKFADFTQLYKHFDKISLGYQENEIANPEDMKFYYSQEDINKYGVVGIEIEVI